MNEGGAEREGDTESQAGSRLWDVSTEPDAGLELTSREIMTWAEVRSSTDWATQEPRKYHSIFIELKLCSPEMCMQPQKFRIAFAWKSKAKLVAEQSWTSSYMITKL